LNGLGALLLDLSQGVSAVGDAFHCVELRGFVVHAGETAHAAHHGTDGNLANNCVGVLLFEGLDLFLSGGNDVDHLFFKVRLAESSAGNRLHKIKY
jgi:hypothetical protein